MSHIMRRLLSFFRRGRLDDELAEEIRVHLELRQRASMDGGMPPADAQPVSVVLATGNYFRLLQAPAALGRTFGPSEDLPPLGTPVRDGVGVPQARAEVKAVAAGLDSEYPGQRHARAPRVWGATDFDPGVLRGQEAIMLGTAGAATLLVMLIACGNVAGLLLALRSE